MVSSLFLSTSYFDKENHCKCGEAIFDKISIFSFCRHIALFRSSSSFFLAVNKLWKQFHSLSYNTACFTGSMCMWGRQSPVLLERNLGVAWKPQKSPNVTNSWPVYPVYWVTVCQVALTVILGQITQRLVQDSKNSHPSVWQVLLFGEGSNWKEELINNSRLPIL